jgi:hypothetical protein
LSVGATLLVHVVMSSAGFMVKVTMPGMGLFFRVTSSLSRRLETCGCHPPSPDPWSAVGVQSSVRSVAASEHLVLDYGP